MKELQIKLENSGELIDSYCELTSTSLKFTRDITKKEWQAVFNSLSLMNKCMHFWIGDCLGYHKQEWGMYKDLAEITGFDESTIKDDKYTANKIESSRRRDNLSFSHHREVAPLEPEKQDYWLDKAEKENLTQKQLRNEIREERLPKTGLIKHFVYNVWNINTITNKVRHPGNIPQEFIENLLYYYTEEGDLVYDPFAGGAPTIDMCEKWERQYYVSDLAPIPEREHEIKKWNLEDGLPDDLGDPKLTFLDPPYFSKKAGDYVEDSISSMSKEDYLNFFRVLTENLYKKHLPNTYVAFLMSNYINYEDYEDSIWILDYANLFKDAGFTIHSWIQCPLSTQQYQAFHITRAKENKQLLAISRDLVIFVKKESKNIIQPLSEEEYGLLEQNILEEGIRNPLVVYGDC